MSRNAKFLNTGLGNSIQVEQTNARIISIKSVNIMYYTNKQSKKYSKPSVAVEKAFDTFNKKPK